MKFSLKNILCKKTESQFIHFFLIGIITATIYLFVLVLLTEKFKIYYILSAIIGGTISSTINFSLNKKITFKEKLWKNFFKEYKKFGIIKITIETIGLGIIFILTDIGGIHYLISSIIVMSLILITSFTFNKFLTFDK